MLARTADDEAVDLCLVEDADPVLADRLVRVLNKSIKTLSQYYKSGSSDRIGRVCQWRDVGH
jgi:hypothetical protein